MYKYFFISLFFLRALFAQQAGNLEIITFPISCIIEIQSLGIDSSNKGIKENAIWKLSDIPVGRYQVNFISGKIRKGIKVVPILENKITKLFIDMNSGEVELKAEPLKQESSESADNITKSSLVDMVFVSRGIFQLGNVWDFIVTPGTAIGHPTHKVKLNDFYIGKHEVSQKLWVNVMGYNPSHFKGDSKPVESVIWHEVIEFCNKLSLLKGLTPCYEIKGKKVTWNLESNGYRLLTEAEWEYAARSGGRNDQKWSGTNEESELNNYAVYYPHSDSSTHSVGTKQPNKLGIYDMSGNVYEWCWNALNIYPSEASLVYL